MLHELSYRDQIYRSPQPNILSNRFSKQDKTISVLKSSDFQSPMEELNFAKQYNIFCELKKSVNNSYANNTNKKPVSERQTQRPLMKQFPQSNVETAKYKPSRDEVVQKRKIGFFSGKNDSNHKEWKSCIKKNDDYYKKVRIDDANYKRGLKMIDQPSKIR